MVRKQKIVNHSGREAGKKLALSFTTIPPAPLAKNGFPCYLDYMASLLEKKNICTAALVAWLVSSVVFAGIFVIEEHIHDHTGDNCRICLEIQIALRIMEAGARLGISIVVAGGIACAACLLKPPSFFFAKSPVELQVRRNC
jgi:hypothetical protein